MIRAAQEIGQFSAQLEANYIMMYSNEPTLITIQSNTPCINGLIPTVRRTSVESDAPMKNIVRVKHFRASPEITFPNSGKPSRTNVFSKIAMTK